PHEHWGPYTVGLSRAYGLASHDCAEGEISMGPGGYSVVTTTVGTVAEARDRLAPALRAPSGRVRTPHREPSAPAHRSGCSRGGSPRERPRRHASSSAGRSASAGPRP